MNKYAIAVAALALAFATSVFAQTPYFHWYRLNEGSGATVTNSATQSGIGTVAAQGVFTDGTGVLAPSWTSPGGLGNTGINLSSPAAFLDSGLDADTHLNTTDFTFEMLVNTNGVSQEGNALFVICTSSAAEVAFYVSSSVNVLSLQVGASVVASGTTGLNDGNWHHVALVYDRTAQTATGYLDGVQQFQATSQSWTFSASTNVVYFNGRTTSAFARWSGLADEIKLDNTARSTSAFVLPNPGGGGSGGGGGDGGDDGGCSTSTGPSYLWVLGCTLLLIAAMRVARHQDT